MATWTTTPGKLFENWISNGLTNPDLLQQALEQAYAVGKGICAIPGTLHTMIIKPRGALVTVETQAFHVTARQDAVLDRLRYGGVFVNQHGTLIKNTGGGPRFVINNSAK